MPIPRNILDVERPTNTVVVDTGSQTPQRYAVRIRSCVKYTPGHNPSPRNGPVIGYIWKNAFVPKQDAPLLSEADCLSYGSAALIYSVTNDIFQDLIDTFPLDDAIKIIVLSSIKVLRPHISNSRIKTEYNRNFISKFYPNAHISKNTISNFLILLGKNSSQRQFFYHKRILYVAKNHHIAIDGTLIQDTSIVNDLSAYSYKARIRGCKDISLIYAYDIEKCEPICANVVPGNYIDCCAYKDFINKNGIEKGIIVADKGFPASQIKEELKNKPDLHYLSPIKRDDTRIKENNMLDFDEVLTGYERPISCKKCMLGENSFLYSYRNPILSSKEESGYIIQAAKTKTLDQKEYKEKIILFGTITFESDLDLSLDAAYKCYEDRWKLELVFRHYKDDIDLTTTNVQSDFSVIGENFINFISAIITCRILDKMKKVKLLKKLTYSEIMDDLSSAWRKVDAPELPKRNDGFWVHTLKSIHEELEVLGLSENDTPTNATNKKPRGRPRTRPLPDPNAPKRRRGRPRIHPLPDPNAPKRKRGRPRVHPVPDPDAPKRGRGRPRKSPPSHEEASQAPQS